MAKRRKKPLRIPKGFGKRSGRFVSQAEYDRLVKKRVTRKPRPPTRKPVKKPVKRKPVKKPVKRKPVPVKKPVKRKPAPPSPPPRVPTPPAPSAPPRRLIPGRDISQAETDAWLEIERRLIEYGLALTVSEAIAQPLFRAEGFRTQITVEWDEPIPTAQLTPIVEIFREALREHGLDRFDVITMVKRGSAKTLDPHTGRLTTFDVGWRSIVSRSIPDDFDFAFDSVVPTMEDWDRDEQHYGPEGCIGFAVAIYSLASV